MTAELVGDPQSFRSAQSAFPRLPVPCLQVPKRASIACCELDEILRLHRLHLTALHPASSTLSGAAKAGEDHHDRHSEGYPVADPAFRESAGLHAERNERG